MIDDRKPALDDAPDVVEAIASHLKPVPLDAARADALRGRVAASTAESPSPPPLTEVLRATEGRWLPFLPRVSLKPLRVDRRGGTQTSLWRLEPGARIPEHDHTGEEECIVLSGSVVFGGETYREGDYLLARPGLHHTEFVSHGGAVLMIRSELTPHLAALFAHV